MRGTTPPALGRRPLERLRADGRPLRNVTPALKECCCCCGQAFRRWRGGTSSACNACTSTPMVGWVDDPVPTATLKVGPRSASMAIVPKEAWTVATRATTTSRGSEPVKTLDAQQLRRKEAHEARVKHFHKQIWTKDPHGGPYKKASLSMPSKDNQRRESEPLSHICCQRLESW